jgi:hypothetical protein
MSIPAGTRFGPYEIIESIGVGGMGEVYRARDTRLDRDVAVKVLPGSVSNDPDRRSRFEREAKAVAALSHPNILAIHDFGVHEGVAYAVMELLHGETLRERLRNGPLPVRKASEIAIQIARGLAAAHDKGLLHRDLKPDNLFLLDDGQVKSLDFGLARQALASPSSGASETVAAMTDPGTVLGTMGYMAPEQVRGQAVDARADLFAFGAVLYEMVSGQRAFQRDTAADTMTAILKEDPPELTGTRAEISPALDRIIRHCLEKNPAERFQTARDVAFALGSLSAPSSTTSGAAPVVAARRSPRWLITAGLMAVTAVIAVAVDRAFLPDQAPAAHFVQKTFSPGVVVTARFMPDGQSIVYSGAASGNNTQLYEVRSTMLEARPFGPARTHLLSVSSRGELAVLTDADFLGQRLYKGTLSRMAIEGSPRPWMTGVREADWSPDGSTMAITHVVGAEDRLEYPIGTVLFRTNGYVSDPRVSPDGTLVAFMDHQQKFDDRGWVRVVDKAGKVTTLAGEFWGEEGLAWLPDGSGVLFAANDRSNAEKTVGDLSYQIRIAKLSEPGVSRPALTSPGDFTIHDVSAGGQWLATRDDSTQGVSAHLRGATADRDLSWRNQNWAIWLSDDGSKALFADGTAGANYGAVWRKTDGSPVVQLGEGNPNGLSPDGRWAFAQIFTPPSLVAYPLGAGETIHVKTGALKDAVFADWFPDGKSVLLNGHEPDKPFRAYRLALPDGTPVPLLPEGATGRAVTRDGNFVLGFDAAGANWYPTSGGAARAIPLLNDISTHFVVGWSRDGRSPLLQTSVDVPVMIEQLDFATGKRSLFKTVSPADPVGLITMAVQTMSADGQQYAIAYQRKLSTLFVVTQSK